jgi:ABC-type antimicrobial peptide transport system permease subunit
MVRIFLSSAVRNIRRRAAFSVINISGLAIGISAALVIFLVVYHEFSFDASLKDRDRIYRVVLDASFNGTEVHSAAVPAPLGSAIENEVTGVAKTVPVFHFQGDGTANVAVEIDDSDALVDFKKQAGIVFTNPQYFELLNDKWIAGTAQALQAPFSVVLTESRARNYFPKMPAALVVGKNITYNGNLTATVSGIIKDRTDNTSFKASEFISLATIAHSHLQQDFMMNVWNDWMAYSQLYVKLSEQTTAAQTEAQLQALNKKHNPDDKIAMQFRLQPITDVHFNPLYTSFGQQMGHKPTLYGLLAVAAFLLLLGCINFINLTTADAANRAKEIGIRKTLGSSRKQLVLQFLGETFVVTLLATIISFGITPMLLHVFSDFMPPGLQFDPLRQPYLFLFLGMLVVLVSFLSGLYPALILSGFQPVRVLKGGVTNGGETRHARFRKTLTVFQFVIAQFFIIGTLMVSKQINYALHTDLGFDKEAIITFEAPRDTVATHVQQLLHAIKALPEVEIASTGFLSPADEGVAFTDVTYTEKPDLKLNVQIRWGNPEYLNVYRIKLLAGRNVAPSDTTREFLVNATYAKALGFQEPVAAVGKWLSFNGKNVPIVGVMQDFHDQSVRSSISPLVFSGSNGDMFHIRLLPNDPAGNSWKNGIAGIQSAFKKVYPNADFNYRFFDETVAQFYKSEKQTASLLRWATGLTIFISCLGLLGLVLFTINTRKKEIGIRKVLGATVANIVAVLSTDVIRLVFIAYLIAVPLAWWATSKWLEEFSYRTPISWWVFIISGVLMLSAALATLSIQIIRAALANPVKSLRTE